MKRSLWIAISLSAALAFNLPASAQDTPAATASAKPAKADGAAKDKGAEGDMDEEARRLPIYYGKVVAPYQKDKVYAIQAKYEDQIAALQQQIKELLKSRDAEIETILLPEQREVLAKLKVEAKAKSKLVGAKKTPPAAPAEAAAPAKPVAP